MSAAESYLRFAQVPNPGRRTEVYLVLSLTSGASLGMIRWHGPWRQYVFWPAPNTFWSSGCMEEIQEFIAGLMAEWRGRR